MSKLDIKSSVTVEKEKIVRSLTSMNMIFKKSAQNQESAIIINSEEGKLQMLANSTGVFIRTLSEAEEISGLNQWCLDGALLSKFIKTMNKGKITIESDDENLYAKQGRSSLKIPLLSKAKDLDIKNRSEMIKLSINSGELISGFRMVTHASALNSHLPTAHGVLFEYYGSGKFSLVATDSKRMAYYTNCEQTPNPDDRIAFGCLPRHSIEEMVKIFEKSLYFELYVDQIKDLNVIELDGHVTTVGFVSPDVEFYTQVISGDFFEYGAILEKINNPNNIVVDKELLIEKINQVGTCSDRSSLTFTQEGVEVKSIEGINSSEVSVFLETETEVTEESTTIFVFNKYVTDALAHVRSKKVNIRVGDPKTPIVMLEYYSDNVYSTRYSVFMMPYIAS